jgi:hypothetical protein
MIQGLATPESGRRDGLQVQSHTQPCLKSKTGQGWRGGEDRDVYTGKIHIIVGRQECEISHLYKSALRAEERCVFSAAPGNLRGTKKHHDTTRGMMATSSQVFSFISRGGTQWVYGVRLFIVSTRTNKRHHQPSPLLQCRQCRNRGRD